MIGKKRKSLLAVLVCAFALVLSLGIMSACGGNSAETGNEPAASAQWHYGTTAPAAELGENGDYYLDTETLTAYAKTAEGTWQKTALYSGAGAPDASAGETGDLYLDTKNGVLYQKGASLWSIVLTLQGKPGRDGVVWFSGEKDPNTYGTDDPAVKDAIEGDFYLDTDNFIVWQCIEKKADGKLVWTELGPIKGDKGEDAAQFFNGNGAPEGNPAVASAKEGDIYLGMFDGFDGNGAGSRLYRLQGETWIMLMDTVKEKQVIVSTPEQFETLIEKFQNAIPAGETVKLNGDIDLTGKEISIDSCEGEFDGGGHTITGMSRPLFDDVKGGAYIHNVVINIENGDAARFASGSLAKKLTAKSEDDVVTVSNVTVTGNAKNVRTAFIDELGSTSGTRGVLNFNNCTCDLDVRAENGVLDKISKLAGFVSLPNNWDVNFTDCVQSGNFTVSDMTNEVIGGFVAYAQGNGNNHITFTRCTNEGNISLIGHAKSDPDVGGFIGKVQRPTNITFNDCTNLGNITVTDKGDTISVGGFIGQTVGGSVTFNGANTNGAYEGQTATPDKGVITVKNTKSTVNAGGFIGLTGAPVTFKLSGQCVNAGSVTVEQTEAEEALNVHIGGLIGTANANVTLDDGAMLHPYINLGALTVTVKNASSHIYMGGVVGNVANGTFTITALTLGCNFSQTLSASGAGTSYIGSFAGYVYNATSQLTESALSLFNNSGAAVGKIGHTGP